MRGVHEIRRTIQREAWPKQHLCLCGVLDLDVPALPIQHYELVAPSSASQALGGRTRTSLGYVLLRQRTLQEEGILLMPWQSERPARLPAFALWRRLYSPLLVPGFEGTSRDQLPIPLAPQLAEW